MKESVKNKVLYLLKKYKSTNDDDNHLVKMYYFRYCLKDAPKDLSDPIEIATYALESVPVDDIKRWRRKLHEESPELRGRMYKPRQLHSKYISGMMKGVY